MAQRRPHQDQQRYKQKDPAALWRAEALEQEQKAERRNKPRQMSEEDLQEILRQVRKERAQSQRRGEPQSQLRNAERAKRPQRAPRPQRPEGQRRAEPKPASRRRPAAKAKPQARRKLAAEAKPQARRKPAAEAKPEPRRRQKKVFTKGFKKGFLIAWGAFALILIAAMALLWTFLNRYEAGLPEHSINEIIEELRNGDLSSLHLVTSEEISIDDPALFGAEDAVSKLLKEKNAEHPLRYVKVNAESTQDENVYMIRSGDENLLKVYLSRKATEKSGTSRWEERSSKLAAEELEVSEVSVQIPSTATLQINGKAVDRSYITEPESPVQLLARLIEEGVIRDIQTLDTYQVRGIFADPEISMTDSAGSTWPCQLSGGVYTAGFEADEQFVQEQTEYVMGLFEPYAKYFSGDAGRDALGQVMLDDSPAYVSASSADVSWMQEHDGIALSEESVSNFRKYSENCYSCDIHFKQDILREGESVRTWDTNMTWIMVKDGNYYLADILTKTGDNEREKTLY